MEYSFSEEKDKENYSIIFRYVLWSIIIFFALIPFFMNFHNDGKAMLSFSLEFEKYGHFYERAFDVNLPLIFIIHTVTAFFINHFTFTPRVIFHSYNLFLCAVGYMTLFFSIRKNSLSRKEQILILDSYAFISVIAPSLSINWGERDHLLFVFSLPWIIQILWQKKATSLSAILAGIGFCIRPHNFVIPLLIMIFEFFREKNFNKVLQNTQILKIIYLCIFYLFSIVFFFPTYINEVFYVSVFTYPQICTDFYSKIVILSIYSFIIFILLFITKNVIKYFYQLFVLTTLCIIWFFANQVWSYTKISLFIPFLMIFVFYIYNEKKNIKKIFFLTIIFHILFNSFYKKIDDLILSKNENYVLFKDFLNNSKKEDLHFKEEVLENAGEKFVLLSTNSWGSNFVRLGKTHHEYAFDWLWPLPWVYAHQNNFHALKIRSLMAHYLILALERQPAPTLLIDRSPQMRGLPFSSFDHPALLLEEFLAQDNEILRNALKKYTLIKTIDACKKGEENKFACRIDVFKAS